MFFIISIIFLILFSLIIFINYNESRECFYNANGMISQPIIIRNHRLWYNPIRYQYTAPLYYTVPSWYIASGWGPFDNRFCPVGCSNLGKGRWGCTAPGYDINACQFAADCAVCGY